jgi:hypothetical protein
MKQTMLSLEARDLESAIEKYPEYVGAPGSIEASRSKTTSKRR